MLYKSTKCYTMSLMEWFLLLSNFDSRFLSRHSNVFVALKLLIRLDHDTQLQTRNERNKGVQLNKRNTFPLQMKATYFIVSQVWSHQISCFICPKKGDVRETAAVGNEQRRLRGEKKQYKSSRSCYRIYLEVLFRPKTLWLLPSNRLASCSRIEMKAEERSEDIKLQ